MRQSVPGAHPFARLHLQASRDETQHLRVAAGHSLPQRLRSRDPQDAFCGVLNQVGTAVWVEVMLLFARLIRKFLRRNSKQLHHHLKKLLLRVAWEQRLPCEQLGHDATKRPHVHFVGVGHPQDDLGRSVEAGLHVGIHLFRFLAATAEINQLECLAEVVAKNDVFGFQIAVDDLPLFQKAEGFE